jgi:hypothetical protein
LQEGPFAANKYSDPANHCAFAARFPQPGLIEKFDAVNFECGSHCPKIASLHAGYPVGPFRA